MHRLHAWRIYPPLLGPVNAALRSSWQCYPWQYQRESRYDGITGGGAMNAGESGSLPIRGRVEEPGARSKGSGVGGSDEDRTEAVWKLSCNCVNPLLASPGRASNGRPEPRGAASRNAGESSECAVGEQTSRGACATTLVLRALGRTPPPRPATSEFQGISGNNSSEASSVKWQPSESLMESGEGGSRTGPRRKFAARLSATGGGVESNRMVTLGDRSQSLGEEASNLRPQPGGSAASRLIGDSLGMSSSWRAAQALMSSIGPTTPSLKHCPHSSYWQVRQLRIVAPFANVFPHLSQDRPE